mmetsp:Transcript_109025/g.339786  ORF Transcript_109025/g.339786 Transcript_109025/m.339786 type:complete len:215 (-) Transcript_109025:196-840(-)
MLRWVSTVSVTSMMRSTRTCERRAIGRTRSNPWEVQTTRPWRPRTWRRTARSWQHTLVTSTLELPRTSRACASSSRRRWSRRRPGRPGSSSSRTSSPTTTVGGTRRTACCCSPSRGQSWRRCKRRSLGGRPSAPRPGRRRWRGTRRHQRSPPLPRQPRRPSRRPGAKSWTSRPTSTCRRSRTSSGSSWRRRSEPCSRGTPPRACRSRPRSRASC